MVKYFVLIVVITLCIKVSESGPWCYSCEKVFLPAICGLVQRCADSEICFTALHDGLNGGKQYRSGCTPASKCSKNITRRAIERRDNPETCNECCSGDFCNSKLCGGIAIKKLDQKHCMKCDAVQKTTDCDQFELCGQDQQCFVKAVDHFNQKFFTMGCQDKSTCNKDNDLCCDDDMCNAGANVTVTTAAPTTTGATTKTTLPLTTVQKTIATTTTQPTTAPQQPTTTTPPTTTSTPKPTTTTLKPTTTPKPTTSNPTTTTKPTTTTPKPTTTTTPKQTTTTPKLTTTTPTQTTTTPKPTTTTTPKQSTTTPKPTTTTTPKQTTTTSKPTTTLKQTTTTPKPTTTVQTTTPTTTVTTTTLPTTQGVPPKISNVKANVNVIFHDNITLVCDVTGSPKPTVSWKFDSSRIFNVQRIGDNLFLQHVTKLNEGSYECFAENNHGTAQETTNVTIKVPVKVKVAEPVVVIKSTDVTGIVRIRCTGSGDPKPKIVWSKLNMPPITQDLSHIVVPGGEIIIHGVNPANRLMFTGVYVCKGDNNVDTDVAYQIIAGEIPYPLDETNQFDKFGKQPGEAFHAHCAPGTTEPDGSPINKEFSVDDKVCVAARQVGEIGKGAGDVTWMIKSNGKPEIIDQSKGKIEFT